MKKYSFFIAIWILGVSVLSCNPSNAERFNALTGIQKWESLRALLIQQQFMVPPGTFINYSSDGTVSSSGSGGDHSLQKWHWSVDPSGRMIETLSDGRVFTFVDFYLECSKRPTDTENKKSEEACGLYLFTQQVPPGQKPSLVEKNPRGTEIMSPLFFDLHPGILERILLGN